MNFLIVLTSILMLFLYDNFADAEITTDSVDDGFLHVPAGYSDDLPITEIFLGNKEAKNKIYVYISPSCLHCGKFVVEDVEKFVKENGNNNCIIIKFLPTSAKDLFIMKLIQNEAKDENGYFIIFKNYIKRVIATINHIKPTEEQIALFKGSKTDDEMIKFQVEAAEFGFSDEKIVSAIPDMDGDFEIALIKDYKNSVKMIAKTLESNELDLPVIIKDEKTFRTLRDASKSDN